MEKSEEDDKMESPIDVISATLTTNQVTNQADDQVVTKSDCNVTKIHQDEKELFKACQIEIKECGGTCKKNMAKNLACYCFLGQAKWETSEEKVQKSLQKKLNRIDKDKTEKNTTAAVPLGLINLGATCYVNSVLQIWFHNTSLRRAFYNIKLDPNHVLSSLHNTMRKIFAQLQGSQLPVVDPTELIDLLRIEKNVQQDALEFSKLVINKFQLQEEFTSFLEEELVGSYVYKIKCLSCSHENSTPTDFSELDLHPTKDTPDLQGLITNYLKEEAMSGDNQYFCRSCQKKSDAVRNMELTRLPKTLTFHLLRFLYDKQQKQRVKINHPVAFPKRIDMKQFMSASQDSNITTEYELTAIMLHRGQSASCGHFIVHNRDWRNGGCWYVLNDDKVSKLSSRHSPGESVKETTADQEWTLHQNEDSPAPKKRRKQNRKSGGDGKGGSKNDYNSDDAYMLMYTRVDRLHGDEHDEPEIPDDVMKFVTESNQTYFREEEESKKKGKKEAQDDYDRKMIRIKLIDCLSTSAGQVYNNWVPTGLIKQFFQAKKPSDKDSNFENLLCPHRKLSPANVIQFKRMTSEAADLIYSDQPTSVLRFRSDRDDVICTECRHQYYKIANMKRELDEDFKEVEQITSGKTALSSSGGDSYLIGMKSLNKWKDKAGKNLDCEEKNEPGKMTSLNSDIVCCHEKLKPERSGLYREIPEACWMLIRKYFRKHYEFSASDRRQCDECAKSKENKVNLHSKVAECAAEHKRQLKNLISGKLRPDDYFLDEAHRFCQGKFYIVPKQFVRQLRRFVGKSPPQNLISSFDEKNNRPGFQVENSVFLCRHQRFIYDPVALIRGDDVIKDGEAPECCLLWASEWRMIKENYNFDHELYVKRSNLLQCRVMVENIPNLADYCSDPSKIPPPQLPQPFPPVEGSGIVTSPGICDTCLAALHQEINSRDLVYKDEKIVVRLSQSKPYDIMMQLQSNFDELPIFNAITGAGATSTKKRRKSRLARGEKYVQVSSSQTLKELKIEIMRQFSIPPYDQHLFLNGIFQLTEDTATLQSLGVVRDSFILLAEDKLPDDIAAAESDMISAVTEASLHQTHPVEDHQAGFEGTVLMEGISPLV